MRKSDGTYPKSALGPGFIGEIPRKPNPFSTTHLRHIKRIDRFHQWGCIACSRLFSELESQHYRATQPGSLRVGSSPESRHPDASAKCRSLTLNGCRLIKRKLFVHILIDIFVDISNVIFGEVIGVTANLAPPYLKSLRIVVPGRPQACTI